MPLALGRVTALVGAKRFGCCADSITAVIHFIIVKKIYINVRNEHLKLKI